MIEAFSQFWLDVGYPDGYKPIFRTLEELESIQEDANGVPRRWTFCELVSDKHNEFARIGGKEVYSIPSNLRQNTFQANEPQQLKGAFPSNFPKKKPNKFNKYDIHKGTRIPDND